MLLSSKLERPTPPLTEVPRAQALQRLRAWRQNRAVFVHAPAGYGKSSLVRMWLETDDAPKQVAWLSLDKSESDPRQFMDYFAAALISLAPDALHSVRPALEDMQSSPLHAMGALIHALQRLDGKLVEDIPYTIVLDDYHRICSPAVDELIGLVLERGQGQLHLVILSRHATAAPLAKYYVAGQILAITTNDLRFQRDELSQYFAISKVPLLDDHDLDRLLEETEGWIAALHLAAIALRERDVSADWLDNLHGDSRWMVEYLTNEVLAHQPPGIQRFLLETSILDRFNASLCEAVTNEEGSRQIIAAIADADLFLIPLDTRQEWFRYHHLFQELLQRRLRAQVDCQTIVERHRRAAAWLVTEGDIMAAVNHYLEAEDFTTAASVVEQHLRPVILRGETYQAQRWLNLLPSSILDQHPRLLLDLSLLHILRDAPNTLDSVLHAERAVAQAVLDEEARATLQGELLVFRSVAHYLRQEFDSANVYARQALQLRERLDDLDLGILEFTLLHLRVQKGQLDAALLHGEEAITALQKAGFALGVISVSRELATVAMHFGKSDDALLQYEQTFAWIDHNQPFVSRELALSYLRAAVQCYWMNRIEPARDYLHVALGLARRLDDENLMARVHCLNQLCAVARPGVDSQVIVVSTPTNHRQLNPYFRCLKVRLLVRLGRRQQAFTLAKRLGIDLRSAPSDHQPIHIAAYLYAYIARGVDLDACKPLLEATLAHNTGIGAGFYMLEVGALSAWRHLLMGNRSKALTELSVLLDLAAQTGYSRHILDIPDLAPLLSEMDHPNAAAFLNKMELEYNLLALAELTQREQSVLRLLAQDYRYREIANELTISINTVRTHVRHIYSKLHVDRRMQAVEMARAAEII